MVFLWKERRENRVPPWIRDFQQDDWITRDEFDQYHLHVIQMSQAQRELLNTRLDEISKQTESHVETREAFPILADTLKEVVPSQPEVEPAAQDPEKVNQTKPGEPPPKEETGQTSPEGGNEPLGMDAPSRAISLFREGRTIDQIAQELRIGRQEAQLLIRMAQHRPSSLAGV